MLQPDPIFECLQLHAIKKRSNPSAALNGDTGNVTQPVAGIFANLVGTGTVNVTGIGTATFTDSVGVVDNQGRKETIFSDFTTDQTILGTVNDVFATYDLRTSIGPASGTSSGDFASYNTSLGALTIESIGTTSTFTATVIPEPASLTLFGIGAVVGLLGHGWRQRKRAFDVQSTFCNS
jgi:hypothetical protein